LALVVDGRAVQGSDVIERVEFQSEGALLRGLLLRPDAETHPPVVIMAHGTSATIGMVADKYAEVFRRNALAVLLYDHRNLGASEGEPRQEINPWIQCRGYLDAIDFVATLEGIDHDRIALWGDSYSAGEVIVVGAIDERVTAIVAQTPVCGQAPPTLEPTRANFDAILTSLLTGDVSGGRGVTTGPLPVVSPDQLGTPSLLEPIQAYRWFIDRGARHGTGWLNQVTRVLPDTPVPYNPVLCAPFLTPPTLMIVAPDDEMTHASYDVARLAYELMPDPKEWYDIAGGHFGLLYHPSPLFDEASGIQAEFLTRWLSRHRIPG
jgi:uncharacterized protein